MYANMSGEQKFINNIIADTRSYKDENFQKAIKIIGKPEKGVIVD